MGYNIIVWGQGFSSNSSGGKKEQFDVRAIGEGSIGDIKVEFFSFPTWGAMFKSQVSHMLWKSWKTWKITKKVLCIEKSWN